MLRKLGEEKGAAIVLLALSISALLGFAALAIDVGNMYLNKARLSNLADAAALAGAQDLPDEPQLAEDSAKSYAAQNGLASDVVGVSVSNNNTVIAVTAARTVPFFFAKIFDKTSANVAGRAVAAIRTITAASGVVPFGIVQQQFTYGDTYNLKAGAGAGYHGNYQALALGGTGATVYQNNIEKGYSGQLHVGEMISTETGVMSGATSKGIDYRMDLDKYATFAALKMSSPRILIVPIIDSLDINGRGEVKILGFAAFFLEGVGKSGNENYVKGKFVQMITTGEIGTGASGYGLYGSTLIE